MKVSPDMQCKYLLWFFSLAGLFELLFPKDFALHLYASRTLHSWQKLMMTALLTHIYIHSHMVHFLALKLYQKPQPKPAQERRLNGYFAFH